MIIERIKLYWAHIYGDMPAFDGQPSRNKAGVMAFHDETQPAALEHLSFVREYGPHAGKLTFKATSLHRCRVEVVGGVTRWRDLLGQMEILDVANVDRNRIFTTGPVDLEIEPGIKEAVNPKYSTPFIHLKRIIVDVDQLDIAELLK